METLGGTTPTSETPEGYNPSNEVEVHITCQVIVGQPTCKVTPDNVPIKEGVTNIVRFYADGTAASIFTLDAGKKLSNTRFLDIPEGQSRPYPVKSSAKKGLEVFYIVNCEDCGWLCDTPGTDTPSMTVE